MTDDREYRNEQSAEDFDAERRYLGGEYGSRGGEWGSRGGEYGSQGGDLHTGGAKGSAVQADRFDAEIAEYDRLASWRTHRSALAAATSAPATSTVGMAADSAIDPVMFPISTDIAVMDNLADNGPSTTLRELLGGDFDLRRAIIETEILTPKYV
jgi:hypothetical protein